LIEQPGIGVPHSSSVAGAGVAAVTSSTRHSRPMSVPSTRTSWPRNALRFTVLLRR
jgi:hypothetical protein